MDDKNNPALLREEKYRTLENVLTKVVHDLNNHLSGIMGYAQMILADSPDEQTRGDAEKVLKEAAKSLEILQNLGGFYQKPSMKPERVRMEAFLQDEVPVLSEAYRRQGIQIGFSTAANNCYARIDRKLFTEVLKALVKNGIESAERKGIPALIQITLQKEKDALIIEVRDNGSGIPENHFLQICDPFFTTQPLIKGKGQGLPMAFNILRYMNGTLDFLNASDGGAVVRISLPDGSSPRRD